MEFDDILNGIIVVLSVLICVLISVRTSRMGEKTVEGFLLGDRKMSMIPVAFSAFATLLSANSITTLVGESFANGFQYFIVPITYFCSQIPIAYIIVPVFHNMKYLSVYEYVEKRYDKSTRLFFSVIYFIVNLVVNAIHLYVPAITVTTVTGISYWITLSISGIVCTLYCVIGGLKAVIWTDVFQSVLMFASVIVVAIAAYVDVGGFQNAWSNTFSGNLHQHFKITEDLNNNYSVWNQFFYILAFCFYTTIGSQACAQRFLCVKNYKTAKNAFILSNILGLALISIVLFTSVAIFSSLTKCNPLKQPNSSIRLPDQIYIYVAEKVLRGIPGALGLVLAGLISAALSSVSSTINALATNALEDYISPIIPNIVKSEKTRLTICRALTALFGVLTVVIGLIVPQVGGVIQTLLLITSSLAGPLGGIIIVAFFHRKSCIKASKIALFVTMCFSIWLSFGSHLYRRHKSQFDHGEQFCPDVGNTTLLLLPAISNGTIHKEGGGGLSIYGVSSFWFPVMSVILSFTLTILLGRIFDEGETDIRLLSPVVLTLDEKKHILKTKEKEFEAILLKDNPNV